MPQYYLHVRGSASQAQASQAQPVACDYPDLASAMARGNRVVSSMLERQGGDSFMLSAQLDIEDESRHTVARILFADVAKRTGWQPRATAKI